MAIDIDVPALTALGHRAGGFSDKVESADKKVDGVGVCLPRSLACATKLSTLESVWAAHLDDLKGDLRVVGDSLVTTARTCRGHDTAGADLFGPISWADQHHYGLRP